MRRVANGFSEEGEVGRFARFLNTFRRDRIDDEIDEEIRFHLDMRTQAYERDGLGGREARDAALRRFGGALQARESARDQRLLAWLDTFRQDMVFGLRVLRRTPSLTLAAIVSLALGIGGTTGVFSVADALIYRPLPVRDAQQLFAVEWQAEDSPEFSYWGSRIDTRAWSIPRPLIAQLGRAVNTTLAGFQELSDTTVFARGEASTATVVLVTGSYFPVLGGVPVAGRLLGEADDKPGALPVAVLGHRYWQARFGADPSAVGQVVRLNGQDFTIVGIAPRGFFGTVPGHVADFYTPVTSGVKLLPDVFGGTDLLNGDRTWWLQAFGRRPAGRDLATVARAMAPVFTSATAPHVQNEKQRMHLVLREAAQGFSFPQEGGPMKPLVVLMVIAALVLLIGCANVANLLLARASSRRREATMRLALGAGRGRLLRQHLTESLLLAGAAGLLGTTLAWWFGGLLLRLAPDPTSVVVDLGLDWRVGLFAAAASLLAGLVAGIVPAVAVSRTPVTGAVHAGTTTTGGWRRRVGLGKPLVAAQIALSLFLLIVAGLFARSLGNLQAQPLGFDASNLLLFDFDPGSAGYAPSGARQVVANISERLRVLPGVQTITWSTPALLGGGAYLSMFSVPDEPGSQPRTAAMMWVAPSFHRALGIGLVAGRHFDERDNLTAPKVAIVNERFAKTFCKDSSPLGRTVTMKIPNGGANYTVVGVVRDTKYTSMTETAAAIVFLADAQEPRPFSPTFYLRAAPGQSAAEAVTRVAHDVAPAVPVVHVRTISSQVAEQLVTQQGLSTLSIAFGAMALLLSAVGLYALVAFAVARRTAEMGIRLALGASRPAILSLVLRDGAKVVIPGALLGLALAIWATRVLTTLLFGLKASDPLTLVGAAGLLIAVALVATVVPARRAASIDPTRALRCE